MHIFKWVIQQLYFQIPGFSLQYKIKILWTSDKIVLAVNLKIYKQIQRFLEFFLRILKVFRIWRIFSIIFSNHMKWIEATLLKWSNFLLIFHSVFILLRWSLSLITLSNISLVIKNHDPFKISPMLYFPLKISLIPVPWPLP